MKRDRQRGRALREARRAIRERKGVAAVYFTLRVLVLITLVRQAMNRNYDNVLLCVMTLGLFLMPTLLERRLRIEFPDTMQIIILLFIFAGEILGEIGAYFEVFAGWDIILHTTNGFLCAAIGFSLVDMLDRNDRFSLTLSPLFMAITAFCFSMTVGVFWEFFEFTVDKLLMRDMQKDAIVTAISSVALDPTGSGERVLIKDIRDVILVTASGEQIPLGLGGYLDIGLADTMEDLLVNALGAAVFSLIGYVYLKTRGGGRIARQFIPQVLEGERPKGQEDRRDSADGPQTRRQGPPTPQ